MGGKVTKSKNVVGVVKEKSVIGPMPVVDETVDASPTLKQHWAEFWTEKWKERLEMETLYRWSDEIAQKNLEAERQGALLGINGEGIEYFFGFIDTHGHCFFSEEDWEELGTDTSHAHDTHEHGFMKSMFDPDVTIAMDWLVFGLIKKVTAARRIKFIDLFLGLCWKGVPCVGLATDYLSYSWQDSLSCTHNAVERLITTMHTLEHSSTRNFFLWWDVFCHNQHMNMAEEDTVAVVSKAMSQVSSIAVSVPNVAQPRMMGRLWCQFELVSAVCADKGVMLLTSAEDREGTVAVWVKAGLKPDRSWLLGQDASTRAPQDKEALLKAISEVVPGGLSTFNKACRAEYSSKVRGFQLWALCRDERSSDQFVNRVKELLTAGAHSNYFDAHSTALDFVTQEIGMTVRQDLKSRWMEAERLLRAAGGVRYAELMAQLGTAADATTNAAAASASAAAASACPPVVSRAQTTSEALLSFEDETAKVMADTACAEWDPPEPVSETPKTTQAKAKAEEKRPVETNKGGSKPIKQKKKKKKKKGKTVKGLKANMTD